MDLATKPGASAPGRGLYGRVCGTLGMGGLVSLYAMLWIISLAWATPSTGSMDGVSAVVAGTPGATYSIGPGDRLSIEVYEEPELSGEFDVGHDGAAVHPLLGAVSVQGQTI